MYHHGAPSELAVFESCWAWSAFCLGIKSFADLSFDHASLLPLNMIYLTFSILCSHFIAEWKGCKAYDWIIHDSDLAWQICTNYYASLLPLWWNHTNKNCAASSVPLGITHNLKLKGHTCTALTTFSENVLGSCQLFQNNNVGRYTQSMHATFINCKPCIQFKIQKLNRRTGAQWQNVDISLQLDLPWPSFALQSPFLLIRASTEGRSCRLQPFRLLDLKCVN